MIFNRIEKDYLTVTRGRRRPSWAPIQREFTSVEGMAGAYLSETITRVRQIDVPVFLLADSFSDLQKIKEDLAKWLIHDEEKELIFKDEPDRVYYAVVDNELFLDELVRWGQGIITFVCPDPYKYGPEKTETFQNAINLKNDGSVESKPIFELTAKKKTTFAMVANENEEYNMIGRPANVNEQIVDEKTKILDEIGDTLSSWSTPSDSTGNLVKGSLGIQVQSYGTGSAWHGPKRLKEIDPIEDFEIDFYVNTRTEDPRQTFRTTMIYYDENMNELGMLRLVDSAGSQYRKTVEARMGPFTVPGENYLISSQNYAMPNQRVWNGLLRVTRKGSMYTFYVARITQAGRHVDTFDVSFSDRRKEYAGKLKFIQIEIENYGTTPTPNEIGINRVLVNRHNKVLIDETPYILDVGDKVTFDHKDDDILVNGEPRNDLKNFGGSFFTLKPGYNTLLVSPEDAFDVSCRYRDAFR